jgi:formylglycine-generating enzyme required for sulfatase activity
MLLALSIAMSAGSCGGDAVDDRQGARAACAPADALERTIDVPGGRYQLGDTRFYPEEAPVVTLDVAAFNMDAYEVTNAQFAAFVQATGYVTRAQRGLDEPEFAHLPEDMRAAGSAVFTPPVSSSGVNIGTWWRFVPGASWMAPRGPGSDVEAMPHHPVVHVTLEDAQAYARWRGRRLPTEAEWEVAARGGLVGAPYAWGTVHPDNSETALANTWQGFFPLKNEAVDGFIGAAPVGCFAPNGFGLYDMIGNVWEWTTDAYRSRRSMANAGNATGDQETTPTGNGVIKGGSYLCAENYCGRFRPAARHSQDLSLGTSHIGFRTVSSGPAARPGA